MASAVANRYARALVDVVTAAGSPLPPEDAVAQVRAVSDLLASSAELRIALLTPAIQTSRKREVMGRLLDQMSVSRLIRNFIYVIIDHRRIGMMSELSEAFEQIMDERLGYVRAEVKSASALDAKRSANLEAELSRLTGKRMRLRFAVDSDLLGGVVARIGSTVYDGSIRGQLQQLRRQLTEQSAG
ncbi:MAG TPA: ATP synthase F1 subunit delta [Bryobacteraceae bacterium]|jgi:F-type H+-transporting ATPase subunit delta|nr:ATP synthase F1 subunit delta [Bryobacteraceae bacterium]